MLNIIIRHESYYTGLLASQSAFAANGLGLHDWQDRDGRRQHIAVTRASDTSFRIANSGGLSSAPTVTRIIGLY